MKRELKAKRALAVWLGVLAVIGLIWASVAPAAHHLVRIRQVYPGSSGSPNAEFVALQLTAAGENQFIFGGGSSVRLYNGSGAETNVATFSSNPPNGENQRFVMVGTDAAAAMFVGIPPDLLFSGNTDALSNAGGAACFTSVPFGGVDCVGWGALAFASPPSPIGTPEAAIPANQILERSIAAGCSALFETSDDTNDSAADFAPAAGFAVSNNSTPVQDTSSCPSGGSSGDSPTPQIQTLIQTSDLQAAIKRCKKKFPKGPKRKKCIRKAKQKAAA
jgi:hypothetical protein